MDDIFRRWFFPRDISTGISQEVDQTFEIQLPFFRKFAYLFSIFIVFDLKWRSRFQFTEGFCFGFWQRMCRSWVALKMEMIFVTVAINDSHFWITLAGFVSIIEQFQVLLSYLFQCHIKQSHTSNHSYLNERFFTWESAK